MMDENTEKNSELDEYGVWVKKAPENAQTEKPQTEDLKLPDCSFLDQQAEETDDGNGVERKYIYVYICICVCMYIIQS